MSETEKTTTEPVVAAKKPGPKPGKKPLHLMKPEERAAYEAELAAKAEAETAQLEPEKAPTEPTIEPPTEIVQDRSNEGVPLADDAREVYGNTAERGYGSRFVPREPLSERAEKAVAWLKTVRCQRLIRSGASFRTVIAKALAFGGGFEPGELTQLMHTHLDLVKKQNHAEFLRKC